MSCWNGEIVRVAFALDCHDREVIGWVATTAGISGEMIRDMMVRCVEQRFGANRTRCNGSPTTARSSPAHNTIETAVALNLEPSLTPGRKPGERQCKNLSLYPQIISPPYFLSSASIRALAAERRHRAPARIDEGSAWPQKNVPTLPSVVSRAPYAARNAIAKRWRALATKSEQVSFNHLVGRRGVPSPH